jgi:hypothetical protein
MEYNKALIVCYDAGGAEVVSSWVRRHPEYEYYFCLDGPAIEIFQRKISSAENQLVSNLNMLIQKTDWILTGTSWASNLEKKSIKFGKEQNKKVISFLDHWSNYPQRFEYNGRICLPDEIWCGDKNALLIAQNFFLQEKLRLVPNPYFQDIKDELKTIKLPQRQAIKKRILYVCEPVAEHSKKKYGHSLHWGYTEYDAMHFFFKKLRDIISMEKMECVRVRKHPSESKNKYDNILLEYPAIPFQKSERNSLIEDCVWADWVVGCESVALVVGLLAGKKVYSCIPSEGKECRLPHSEIIDLRSSRGRMRKFKSRIKL